MSKRAKQKRATVPVNERDDSVTLDAYDPDYEHVCENCGSTPVVTGLKDGKVVLATGMCGVCTWGEAACVDPANW